MSFTRIPNLPYLRFPGMGRNEYKNNLVSDSIFFIISIALPSSFFGMVNRKIFQIFGILDIYSISFILTIPYLIIFFSRISVLKKITAGKAFIVLNLYLLFQLFYSLFIKEIPFFEVLKVFRINFYYPFAALAMLLYLISINQNRRDRIFRWLLIATLFQTAIYIISNLIGVDLFFNKNEELGLELRDIGVVQNMASFPRYSFLLIGFGFISFLVSKDRWANFCWILGLTLSIISVVRFSFVTAFFNLFLISFLLKAMPTRTHISQLKLLFYLAVIIMMVIIFFPNQLTALLEKSQINSVAEFSIERTFKDNLESHNYVLRVKLIEDAWVEINATIDNLVFGKGYIRYGTPGDYDLVFGGDTYVAPILYCEGILGLVVRVLPILILFIKYLKMSFFLRKSEEKYKLYAVFSLSVILSALIGYLQTSLFVQYTLGVFVILSLEIIVFFDKKIKT